MKGQNLENKGQEQETATNKAIKEAVRSFDNTTEGQVRTLVIRHDNPTIIYERQKVSFKGILSTPFLYLEKRVHLIDQFTSTLVVNREELTLSMEVNEQDHFKSPVTGSLEYHPDFKKWGINSGSQFAPHVLGEFMKMNRYDFESNAVQEGLTTLLKNFHAKVNKELERVENKNGDRRILQAQTVNSNLPENFNINVPVFKGTEKVKIEVEIYVNPDTLQCSLHSAEVNERTALARDTAIDKELDRIKEIAPDLLIIEE